MPHFHSVVRSPARCGIAALLVRLDDLFVEGRQICLGGGNVGFGAKLFDLAGERCEVLAKIGGTSFGPFQLEQPSFAFALGGFSGSETATAFLLQLLRLLPGSFPFPECVVEPGILDPTGCGGWMFDRPTDRASFALRKLGR